jgi:YD repeat-containing protein
LSAAIDSIIAARPNSYLHYSTWEGNSLRLCVGYFVQLKCTWNDLVSPVCPAGEEASRTAENGCALVQQASNGDACTPPAPNTPGDSTATGDTNPINLATGNKFQQVVDFETPGPNKLAFIRSYNSMSTYDTNMGSGWRNNYSQRLLFKLGGAERWLVTADGMRRKYWNNGGVWQPKDNDTVITVETVGSGLEVTYTDDTVETYDAAGKLLSILKRNGYEQTLAYDGNGDLASVTDSYGRALTFTITDGLITGMTDPDGNVTTYVYGESDPALKLSIPDRLDEVVYPDDTPLDDTDNPREQYLYEDPTFRYALTGIIDENGNRFATWAYDASLRATLSEHAGGAERVDIVYDDVANTRTATNALGKQTVYTFQKIGGRNKLVQTDGLATASCPATVGTNTYDSNGFLSSNTDREGNVTDYNYSNAGLLLSKTEAQGTAEGRTISRTWHPAFRVPTQVVGADYQQNLASGFPRADAGRRAGPHERHELRRRGPADPAHGDRHHRPHDPLRHQGRDPDLDLHLHRRGPARHGRRAAQRRDRRHDLYLRPAGQPDQGDQRARLGNPDDGAQRARPAARPGRRQRGDHQAVTSFVYDDVGQVTQVTLPDGSQLDYVYDAARRLTEVQNDLGEKIVYTLDALGNRTKEEAKSSTGAIVRTRSRIVRTRSRVYDELGRLLRELGADLQQTDYAYDLEDNLTVVVDPVGAATVHAYDALNRLVQTTDDLNGVTSYAYDARDNLTGVTDPRGLTTDYTRNAFGEAIQLDSPDTGITVYRYDTAGNLVRQENARGAVVEYDYDALGRVAAKRFPGEPGQDVAYGYDDATAGRHGIGRLTSITDATGGSEFHYDARGNLTLERRNLGGVTYDTDYAYDAADRLAEVVYPSGRIVTYQRDLLGRVSGVTTQADAVAPVETLASNIDYTAFGPMTGLDLGNGLATILSYDQDYRLSTLATGRRSPTAWPRGAARPSSTTTCTA